MVALDFVRALLDQDADQWLDVPNKLENHFSPECKQENT